MSAPFRELVVELPRALFEVLQGIAEAAVRPATMATPRRDSELLAFLRGATPRRLFAERYGWLAIEEPIFAADDDAVDLVVRRGCGHRSRVRLDGRLFTELRPRAALDELDLQLFRHDEHERRCYCVPRPS